MSDEKLTALYTCPYVGIKSGLCGAACMRQAGCRWHYNKTQPQKCARLGCHTLTASKTGQCPRHASAAYKAAILKKAKSTTP